jgi:hypothetical protein
MRTGVNNGNFAMVSLPSCPDGMAGMGMKKALILSQLPDLKAVNQTNEGAYHPQDE